MSKYMQLPLEDRRGFLFPFMTIDNSSSLLSLSFSHSYGKMYLMYLGNEKIDMFRCMYLVYLAGKTQTCSGECNSSIQAVKINGHGKYQTR